MSAAPDKMPFGAPVALVAGASRGAGRGIALALAGTGATVYVTGRTRRGARALDGAPGSIDETADEVTARGGLGVAVEVDHTDAAATRAVVERIVAEHGRIDVAAVAVWGGNEHHDGAGFDGVGWMEPFWAHDVRRYDETMETGVRAAFLVAHAAARPMAAAKRGLLAFVTDWLEDEGNLCWMLAHQTIQSMVARMARQLARDHVACVGLLPGFMRTERVTMHMERDPALAELHGQPTETPEYTGRAVAALAADPQVMEKSGRVLEVGALAPLYGFTDVDGTQPRWRRPVA
jgi:NAD(P)-dependent dehydrogenase (short-subunit alcohol dehydrogenase family)